MIGDDVSVELPRAVGTERPGAAERADESQKENRGAEQAEADPPIASETVSPRAIELTLRLIAPADTVHVLAISRLL